MTIIDALLKNIRDAPVHDLLVGVFWTAVVLDTVPPRCGLASTLRPLTRAERQPVLKAGRLLERSGRELAEMLRSPSTLEASIGMAAYNALLAVDVESCIELNARDMILKRGAKQRVAIVGHFPFVDRVRQTAAKCWVLELNPGPGDLSAEKAAEVLPQADVVALTSTSLINHTFEDLIALCRDDALVVLLGASTPLTPLLFNYGVSAIAGTHVVEIPATLRAVGQGATLKQIPGQRLMMIQESQSSQQ